MRAAIATADVGDAALGEDPTVNQLEELAAAITGKQAALLVASGTQGNLIALLTHCRSRDAVIVGDRAYTHRFEQGGMAAIGGLYPYTVPNLDDGTMSLDTVGETLQPAIGQMPPVRLLCLESTHNLCYGSPLTAAYTRDAAALAHRHGAAVHLDGARIFNAAKALGVEVRELVQHVDSVTFCLNKGLCAPLGSLLCGTRGFVEKARHVRAMLGGNMHQAGMIAAAGIVALSTMVERLEEDHANARRLAIGIGAMHGYRIDLDRVCTNLIYFDVASGPGAEAIVREARRYGVLLWSSGAQRLRAMTHNDVTTVDIDVALDVLDHVAKGCNRGSQVVSGEVSGPVHPRTAAQS
jgi:threonine aldolase